MTNSRPLNNFYEIFAILFGSKCTFASLPKWGVHERSGAPSSEVPEEDACGKVFTEHTTYDICSLWHSANGNCL